VSFGGNRVEEYAPHIMLVLSSACPAACSYCFGPHTGPVMSSSTLESTLDFIASVACDKKTQVTFHGGEPLVAGHMLFRQALEGLRSRLGRECRVSVQSNLWLLDDAFCELFVEYDVSIGTSLDGPQSITDLQRGKDYFERTMAGIQRAHAHGLAVGCIATVTPAIASRWREVLEFFRAERMDFSLHAAVPALSKADSPHSLSPSAYADLLREILDGYVQVRHDLRLGSLDEICHGFAANDGKVCTFRDCLGMFLAIDPTGDIFPCQRFCSHGEHRLGTVADKPTLNELLSTPVAQRWRTRELEMREACAGCEHFNYCKGGCPYNALANGTSPRDPYCVAYKSIFHTIKTRMLAELSCEENMKAITTEPWDGRGHPLARRGPLLDLTRSDCHPSEVARHARRIVAAVEIACEPDRNIVADHLVREGICRTVESAHASLEALDERLHPTTRAWNNLYLHVTFACQLHCTHCYAVARPDGAMMATPAVLAVLGQAQSAKFRQLVITGGEPLMHVDRGGLLSGIRRARGRLGCNVSGAGQAKLRHSTRLVLRTNFALPLTHADLIAVAVAFDQVVVSIDGTREAHDALRGAGSYDAALANIERYTALTLPSKGELSLSTVLPLSEFVDAQEDSIRKLAKKFGIQKTRFRPLLPLGRAAQWRVPPTLEGCYPRWVPIRQIEQGFRPTSTCGLGQNLYVDPYGETFPCYALHGANAQLGNVLEQGLAAVLDSVGSRDLAFHSVDTNLKCRECDVRYLCGGACKAWCGEACDRDLDAPPPDCSSLRERAERLLGAAKEYLSGPGQKDHPDDGRTLR
jgi:uncharacterized protein